MHNLYSDPYNRPFSYSPFPSINRGFIEKVTSSDNLPRDEIYEQERRMVKSIVLAKLYLASLDRQEILTKEDPNDWDLSIDLDEAQVEEVLEKKRKHLLKNK